MVGHIYNSRQGKFQNIIYPAFAIRNNKAVIKVVWVEGRGLFFLLWHNMWLLFVLQLTFPLIWENKRNYLCSYTTKPNTNIFFSEQPLWITSASLIFWCYNTDSPRFPLWFWSCFAQLFGFALHFRPNTFFGEVTSQSINSARGMCITQ